MIIDLRDTPYQGNQGDSPHLTQQKKPGSCLLSPPHFPLGPCLRFRLGEWWGVVVWAGNRASCRAQEPCRGVNSLKAHSAAAWTALDLPPLQQPSESLLLPSPPMCCFFLALGLASIVLIIAPPVMTPARFGEPLTWRASFVPGGISLRVSLLHLDRCRHRMSLGL